MSQPATVQPHAAAGHRPPRGRARVGQAGPRLPHQFFIIALQPSRAHVSIRQELVLQLAAAGAWHGAVGSRPEATAAGRGGWRSALSSEAECAGGAHPGLQSLLQRTFSSGHQSSERLGLPRSAMCQHTSRGMAVLLHWCEIQQSLQAGMQGEEPRTCMQRRGGGGQALRLCWVHVPAPLHCHAVAASADARPHQSSSSLKPHPSAHLQQLSLAGAGGTGSELRQHGLSHRSAHIGHTGCSAGNTPQHGAAPRCAAQHGAGSS